MSLRSTVHRQGLLPGGREIALRRGRNPAIVHELLGFREEWPEGRRIVPALHRPTLTFCVGSTWDEASWRAPTRVRPIDETKVYGLSDGHHILTSPSPFQAIAVRLPLLGGRRVFGVPMSVVAGDPVGLADLVGPSARVLEERVATGRTWDARFDAIERFFESRATADPPSPHERLVAEALRRIERAAGSIAVADLARGLGCSHRHLISLFHDNVGAPPRLVARHARFQHVLRKIKNSPAAGREELATTFGFSDSAHLSRECRLFMGETLSEVRPAIRAQAWLVPEPEPRRRASTSTSLR